MPRSEAQKRARAKYTKEKVKTKRIEFYPGDKELLEWAQKQPTFAGYVKELIRKDMLSHG